MSGLFIALDVEYDSDDKIIEAGPLAELLYVRSLTFAKRKLNDGRLKVSQLSVVGARIPNAAKHAARLVEVGLWAATDDGWIIVAWSKRNRSSTDVQVQREIASEAGERGNHERWHLGPDGKPSPKCRLCRETRIGLPDRHPIGSSSPESEPLTLPLPEPLPEPKPSQKESSSVLKSVPAPASDDDDGIINEIIRRASHRLAQTHSNSSATGYAATCADELATERQEIQAMLNAKPFLRATPEDAAKSYLARRGRQGGAA